MKNFDNAVDHLLNAEHPLDPFGHPRNLSGIFTDLSDHKLPTMIVAPNDKREERELVNAALLCADRFILLSKSPAQVALWNEDSGYHHYTENEEDFRRMVDTYRDLIEKKLMIVIPRSKRFESEYGDEEREDAVSFSKAVDVALFSATFVNELLEPQASKQKRFSRAFIPIPLLSHRIYNSVNDPKDVILRVREENKESAAKYMKALKKMMKASAENLAKSGAQDLFDEIYEESINLQEKHLQIVKRYRFKSIELIATCAVAFLCTIKVPLPKELLLLLSASSLGSRAFNYFVEKHLDLERLRENPYYVPWKIGSHLGTV